MSLLQKRQDVVEGELTNIKGDIKDMKTSIQALNTMMECMIDAKLCDIIAERVDERVQIETKMMLAIVE